MSQRTAPRSHLGRRSSGRRHQALFAGATSERGIAASAMVLACFYGCASSGSTFGTGGATGTSTGGGSTTGSGGDSTSGGSSGGQTGNGSSGGSTETGSGSGGSIVAGSGGNGSQSGGRTGTGSGGSTAQTGGSTGTGSGGTTAGTGGATGTGSGGSTVSTGTGGSSGPACPKATGICHEFLANDNSRNQINYVNEFDPTKNWTKPVGDTTANSPRTIEIVDNSKAKNGKAVLVSLEKGYGEFDLTDGTQLAKVSNKAGVSGACRLPDGTTALGTDAAISIVNASGSEMKKITLPTGDNLRAINRNPVDGHFWFSKTSLLYNITDSGSITWMGDMGSGTKGYAVWWREGGGAYATTGDPSTVIEMDASGKIIKTIGGKTEVKEVALDFFSGFVRLPNGNFVVANWLGHLSAPAASTPHVVEFDSNNKVVWQWGNQTLARQITNVYVFR